LKRDCEERELPEAEKKSVFETKNFSILSGKYASPVALLLITITTLLIYSKTFYIPFLFDDKSNILENYNLRDLKNFWPPSGTRYIGFLSFALNYHFGGGYVFGYHLVNIAVHIINGLLVYWLVILTFKTPIMERTTDNSQLKYFIALSSALIFVSHPIQTQAVTYISQRLASLTTLFYLLSLVMFIKWRLSTDLKSHFAFYLLSLLSVILAMKTKEISFTIPFIIVLYEYSFFYKTNGLWSRLLYLGPFLLTLFIIPVTIFAPELGFGVRKEVNILEDIRQWQIRDMMTLSWHDYLITQFRVVVTYIRLLFFPVNQNLDYDYQVYKSLFEPEVFLSFLFLLSIFVFAIYLHKKSRKTGNGFVLITSFGILWFFITLSVESSIIPIKDVIFEHRLYLPSVGMVIAFNSVWFYGFDLAKSRLRFKIPLFIATCILLLITAMPLSFATYKRNLVWKDGVTIWEDVVHKSPDKARGHYNLGLMYAKQGRMDEAINEFQIAISMKFEHVEEVHNNLGNVYVMQGRREKAIEEYKEALRLKPDFAVARYNLGLAYYKQDLIDKAIEEYREALRLVPYYEDAHYNLGLAYKEKGMKSEAIREFESLLKLNPQDTEARKILQRLVAE
jgi:tetratricopeptide (TPR) repeat protein